MSTKYDPANPYAHEYHSREDWAIRRQSIDQDDEVRVSLELSVYISPPERDAMVLNLKKLWSDFGRRLKAAKAALPNWDGDTHSYFDLSDAEQELAGNITIIQEQRKHINLAIKALNANDLPGRAYGHYIPSYALREGELGEAVKPIFAKLDAVTEAAWEEKRRERALRPVDDAAWEEELQRRARIERYLATGVLP